MNKEELLRMFLEDELIVSKGYLKDGESKQFKWMDNPDSKFISTLRIAITGDSDGDTKNIIERRINQLFNREL